MRGREERERGRFAGIIQSEQMREKWGTRNEKERERKVVNVY